MNPNSTTQCDSNASGMYTYVRWSGLLYGLALLPYAYWFLTRQNWINIINMAPVAILALLTIFSKNRRVLWTTLVVARVFALGIVTFTVWLSIDSPSLIGTSLSIGTVFVCAGYLLGAFCTRLPRKTEEQKSCETTGDNVASRIGV